MADATEGREHSFTISRPVAVLAVAALLVPWLATDAHAQLPGGVSIQYEVLTTDTEEPIAIAVADDGRVIWTEREGAVKVLTIDGELIEAGRIPVSGNQCDQCVPDDSPQLEEGGLYGILLADDFNASGRLYLYYAVPGSRVDATQLGIWRLSTFVLDPSNNLLDLGSEQTILEVPAHWDHCCHYGGDLNRMPDGTILLSVGDDVPASSSGGYGPRDNSETWLDAELNVQNPADRRGKILRLMPDGSVPDGSQPGIEPNPFVGQSGFAPYLEPNPDDDPLRPWLRSEVGSMIAYDPYVYAMGFKQPYKGAVNPWTGHAYFGDVGPDATAADPSRGPEGFDERNVVPPGGGSNHGWPRCIADNKPYVDVDWTTMEVGDLLDCSEMTPAFFFYPAQVSLEFPLAGVGGRTGMPAEFYSADSEGALRLPPEFDDTLIDLEWSRNWLATFDVTDGIPDASTFTRWDPVLALGTTVLAGPIDAVTGPDGALYVAEYGVGYYTPANSRIGRVTCFGCTPDPADYVVEGTDEATAAPTPTPTPGGSATPEPAPATGGGFQPDGPLPATGGGAGGLALAAGLLALGIRRRPRVI